VKSHQHTNAGGHAPSRATRSSTVTEHLGLVDGDHVAANAPGRIEGSDEHTTPTIIAPTRRTPRPRRSSR
jgi:hypothetical protein